jgi:two-component system nitrate/nitrite sensor histidine kinase NarX
VNLEVIKDERWRFLVRDNGAGFDTAQPAGTAHVGMKIMQERAERIGAEVKVTSVAGQGTRVLLTLPPHPVSGAGPNLTEQVSKQVNVSAVPVMGHAV